METRTADDLQKPFIAEDGLEYACFADRLIGKPAENWRNGHILNARKAGRSEQAIRLWVEAYDGDDPSPSPVTAEHHLNRVIRANFAVDKHGHGLRTF